MYTFVHFNCVPKTSVGPEPYTIIHMYTYVPWTTAGLSEHLTAHFTLVYFYTKS